MDHSLSLEDKINSKDKLEEFKKHAKKISEELIEDIKNGNIEEMNAKLKKFSPAELDIVMKESQPLKSIGPASQDKFVVASVNNLREEYYKKLLTTSIIGFVYRMLEEYTIKDEDLTTPVDESMFREEVVTDGNFQLSHDKIYKEELKKYFINTYSSEDVPEKYEDIEKRLSEDELTNISITTATIIEQSKQKQYKVNQSKLFDYVQQKVNEQSEEERKVIKRFLDSLFKYDPNEHLEPSYDSSKDVKAVDPEREAITTDNEDNIENIVYSNIPPNDTFSRFTSYYEVNYEKLRIATHNLYNVKPDLEYAMIVYDVFNDYPSVERFIHKYTTDSKFSFLTFSLNKWTFLGPFDKNKERIKFYNKNNKILEGMLEQQEKDAILGEQLIKDRIRKKKVRNTKYYGPDDPKFALYKKENPSLLETEYGIKVTDTEDGGINVESEVEVAEDGTGVDEDGTPLNAIEFDVHSINAKTGSMFTKKMYSKAADAPNK